MPERRSYERLSLDGNIEIKSENGTPRIFGANLDNLGFGGFAMYTPEKIAAAAVVEFEMITQLSRQPLIGKGKIRHISAPEKYTTPIFTVGIEFTDVNQDLVLYLIKRAQLKIANETRVKKQVKPLDFIPY
jgi:hypothetical protein